MVGKCVQFYVKRFFFVCVATFRADRLGAGLGCTLWVVFSQLNGFKFEFYLLMREESSSGRKWCEASFTPPVNDCVVIFRFNSVFIWFWFFVREGKKEERKIFTTNDRTERWRPRSWGSIGWPAKKFRAAMLRSPAHLIGHGPAGHGGAVAGGVMSLHSHASSPPHARTSLFDSCHRKIRLIGGGPVAFLGGLVAWVWLGWVCGNPLSNKLKSKKVVII